MWDYQASTTEDTQRTFTCRRRNFSILTLSILTEYKWPQCPNQKPGISNCVKNTRPNHMLPTRDSSQWKSKQRLRVKGWKKVFQANEPHKEAGAAILISDKVDVTLKSIRRENEDHFILMKGTIHQEEKSILNIYMHQTQGHPSTLKNSNGPHSTDRP
jgi:hypothetical protein